MGAVIPGYTINCQIAYCFLVHSYTIWKYKLHGEVMQHIDFHCIDIRYSRNVMHQVYEQSETYQAQRKGN